MRDSGRRPVCTTCFHFHEKWWVELGVRMCMVNLVVHVACSVLLSIRFLSCTCATWRRQHKERGSLTRLPTVFFRMHSPFATSVFFALCAFVSPSLSICFSCSSCEMISLTRTITLHPPFVLATTTHVVSHLPRARFAMHVCLLLHSHAAEYGGSRRVGRTGCHVACSIAPCRRWCSMRVQLQRK